jgi:hypothetical protein
LQIPLQIASAPPANLTKMRELPALARLSRTVGRLARRLMLSSGRGPYTLTIPSGGKDMIVTDAEIARLAREMIARHGPRAALVASERLNEMIDRNNRHGRDLWACVVHVIHERQGTGPVWLDSGRASNGGDTASQ